MKKPFSITFVAIALATLSFISPPDTLVGRWQQKFKGATALLVFRTDNTYDIFVNGKTFVSGQYTVRQDTFALSDPACNAAYYGTYKLGFFAQDSVRFTTIADTCRPRNGGLHNFTAGRRSADAVKVVKP